MKDLTSDEMIEIIDKEIEWCIKNPSLSPGGTFFEGFIKGLEQAKDLILTASIKAMS